MARLLLASFMLLGGLAGWLYVRWSPSYSATGILQLVRGIGSGTRGVRKRDYGDEIALLHTRNFYQEVQQQLSPADRALITQSGHPRADKRKKGSVGLKSGADGSGVIVTSDSGSALLFVTDDNQDPRVAAALVNATMRAALGAGSDAAVRRAAKINTFFAPRVDDLKREIAQNEMEERRLAGGVNGNFVIAPGRQRAAFDGASPAGKRARFTNPKTQSSSSGTSLGELQLENAEDEDALSILDAAARRTRLAHRLAQARLDLLNTGVAAEDLASDRVGDRELISLRVSLANAEATYGAMSVTLGPANPELQAHLADLKVLEQQVEDLNRRDLSSARTAVVQDQAQSKLLDKASRVERDHLLADRRAEQRLLELEANMAISLTLLGDLQQTLRSAPAEAALNGLAVEIVSYAEVPLTSAHRSSLALVAVGATFGGILAGCLSVLHYLLRLTHWTVDAVENAANAPALALLPQVCASPPHTGLRESLEELRESLPLMRSTQANAVLLFTSSKPGEGTTSIASEFASLLAVSGERVLLIDANLYHPGVDRHFDLPNDRGVNSILACSDTLPHAIKQLPVGDSGRVLDVLLTGPQGLHPVTALHADAMAAMLQQARLDYKYVIVDSAIIPAPRGSISSQCVDLVFLIVRFGRINPHEIGQSRARLARQSLAPSAVLLNGIPAGRTRPA